MLLSWWTEITGPIAFGPDGRLNDRILRGVGGARRDPWAPRSPHCCASSTTRAPGRDRSRGRTRPPGSARAHGGRLRAGRRLGGRSRPGAGDRRSRRSCEALRTVAADPDVQISAMPFSAPLMPAMLAGGLSVDLDEQRTLGDRTVVEVLGPAGQPTTSFERPPFGCDRRRDAWTTSRSEAWAPYSPTPTRSIEDRAAQRLRAAAGGQPHPAVRVRRST